MALTEKQILLLSDLLNEQARSAEGVDPVQFKLKHEDDVDQIDRLVRLNLIDRTNKNKFRVPINSILELAGQNKQADTLLATCQKTFDTLKKSFRESPDRHILIADLIYESEISEKDLHLALPYLLHASIAGGSTDLTMADAYLQVTETILQFKTFDAVLDMFKQWNRPSIPSGTNREKQQKFRILDSPTLLEEDLQNMMGALGRAVLYIDLDNFKQLNSDLTESIVDKLVLPVIHEELRNCIQHIGFAYAEGGDEFTVFLPNSAEGMALDFANAVRLRLQELRFADEANQVSVSASIGVAHELSTSGENLLKERANLAKKSAKENGKNCVEAWRPDGSYLISRVT